MPTVRIALVIGLATVAALPVCSDDKEASKADLEMLQGEWSMVSGSAGGQPVPEAMLAGSKRVCQGDETRVTIGDQLILRAKFALDPTKKPKAIDYQVLEGPTKDKTHLGIYELEGDTVKFCFGSPGAERPTDFADKPGEGRTSSVWKKIKK